MAESHPYRIKLQPFHVRDTDQLAEWSATPEFLLQWAGSKFQFPLTRKQMRRHMRRTKTNPVTSMMYSAVLEASDEHVGNGEIGAINYVNNSATLQRILVGPEHARGNGIGGQIIRGLLRVGFEQLNLHRIDLYVFDFNEAAIQCYKRQGMQIEGTLRDARRSGDTYWSLHQMSILRPEWASRREGKG